MLRLSKRLQAAADLVGECSTAADVGTDHGYIPVYLVAQGKAERAIAMDIREGPLGRAREHIRQYGLERKIETRLSDGCLALRPGEADVIVIAGMGGALMQRILRMGEDTAKAAGKLVLQPQSEIPAFREFVLRQGYQITAEDMVLEDGKYYPMMAVEFTGKTAENEESREHLHEEETRLASVESAGNTKSGAKGRGAENLEDRRIACKFGPLLLEQRHPVLKQYLLRQQKQKQNILQNLKSNARQDVTARENELLQELLDIEAALKIYAAGKE
ncbi:MAG: SAM-dependent methyltransferase [Lachnospiraceae bacterium]|nr:SAM-dependent methyltransferase [Lachnospiraceae bacterium]